MPWTEGRTIVSEYGLGMDAQRGVPGVCFGEEIDRVFLGFIGIHPSEGNPGMVIDGNEQDFPAGPAYFRGAVAMDTVLP
jgi:hypothetical protein